VILEPNRDKKHVSLRGLPDHVEAAKKALEALDLVSHTRQLVGKEYATLVGKSGATINTFVDDHQVMIDVDEVREEEWLATVTGPQTNVEACFNDIERVLAMNRDAVEMIPVDAIVRSALLSESGALIKKFQSEVNEQVRPIGGQVIVNFSKDQDDDNKATLVIKGRYASVAVAKDMVNAMITNVLSSLIVINVDTFVIPRIIGKGGETIKKLKDGKAVNIEVDKIIGRVVIQSADHDEAKRVEGEVNAIILENQLVRIDFQPTVVKSMFREITRSDIKTKITELVWFGLDEDTNQIILRGPRNKVSAVKRFAVCPNLVLLLMYLMDYI
jgi:predicted PilT family ATPase